MTAGMETLATSDNPVLEARAVGRRATRSEQWLIRDVNLSIRSGNRLAIVGPSGSGKSVLLRALCLLDPIDAGSLRWNTKELHHQDVPEFRSHVMYMHQQPTLLEGTVEENLRNPFALKVHLAKQFDGQRIVRLLTMLGRDESFLAKQHVHLSGGESQLVALLRAIQLDPQVLLLDEPTAALDSDSTALVEKLVAYWIAELPGQRATVWVSHSQAQTNRIAEAVYRLDQGHLQPVS